MRVVQMNPFSSPLTVQAERRSVPPKKEERAFKLDFKSFKKDDWILLGIIFTLILEGSDDYILLCALGYLFIVGIM